MTDTVRFRADPQRRTIAGLIVEWGTVARAAGGLWRFAADSLHWSQVGRVKLNLHHDRERLVGRAISLQSTPLGLHGKFLVSRTPEGDQALAMAADGTLDGFSVEVDFDDAAGDGWEPDQYDPGVRFVRRGTLTAVALTGHPAFDNARVASVAASRDARLEVRLTPAEAETVRAAADAAGVSMSDVVRQAVSRAYTRPRPVYALGVEPQSFSLVRDLWVESHPSEGDEFAARDRLSAHRGFMRELRARFATGDTSTLPEVIPPGYRPLLASIESDRPLYAAASKGTITDSSSFLVPANLSEASVDSAAAPHVEGTNPSEGTLEFAGRTVSPTGISGTFRVTREVVDSSNPAIDAVAMSAMREQWNRQAEQRIYAELNGSNGQAGTITDGRVPSGAMVRTSTGDALPADLRKAILAYVDVRKRSPRSVVASSRPSVAEALEELDLTHWPLSTVTVALSPFITGTQSGDGDVFILSEGDLWAWSSALLEFTYRERSGPAHVDLALFGYYATALINPVGLAAIRHT